MPEIRVWHHSNKGDSYKVFSTFQKAFQFIKMHPEAEEIPLIAINGCELNLFAFAFHSYRDS